MRAGSRQRVYAPLQVVIGGVIVDALFLKSSCGHLPISSYTIIIPRATDSHLVWLLARVKAGLVIDARSSLRFDQRPAALTHELAFPILAFLRVDQPVVRQHQKKVDRKRQNVEHRNQSRQSGEFRSAGNCHHRKKTYEPKKPGCGIRQLLGWADRFREVTVAHASVSSEKQALPTSSQESRDSASRFVHSCSMNQRRLLHVNRVAIRANHTRANNASGQTVPNDTSEKAKFQKVSGIKDGQHSRDVRWLGGQL